MKVSEQYFPVVLYIMLCKVVLPFESVAEILSFLPFKLELLSCTFLFHLMSLCGAQEPFKESQRM